MRNQLLIAAAALVAAIPAQAGVVYSNNFDTEGTTSTPVSSLTGLTITDGTVDLVTGGDYGIICRNGSFGCIDLDGSTGDAGVIRSASTYSYNAGDLISLALSIGGSQVDGYGTNGVNFGFEFAALSSFTYSFSVNGAVLFSDVYGPSAGFNIFGGGIPFDAPFDDLVLSIRPTTGGALSFYIADGVIEPSDVTNDNVGLVLDNLSLDITAVPEPTTWAMMIGGFGLVGGTLRRRSARPAFA